jgi:zinc D-Ala-D-Ala dipeptidase
MKVIFLSLILITVPMAEANPDFVDLSKICSGIKVQMNYATPFNFTGDVVPGYKARKAYFARGPAEKLCLVQQDALKEGLTLKVFDSYRPAKAVASFLHWASLPETNPELKKIYHPKYSRQEILDLGFIAKQSSHSKGSAIDLTLERLSDGSELDMGTPFDYFDSLSYTESRLVTRKQYKNRMKLRSLMEKHGFKNFSQEWWHYSYRPEPYPDQYFDFDVE